jgi:hypothetical protein
MIFALLILLLASAGEGNAQNNLCGLSPDDWCTVPGDICNRHNTVESCKADRQCYGMAYRGESVEACVDDGQGRGFAVNCPTVGCTSAPPRHGARGGPPR